MKISFLGQIALLVHWALLVLSDLMALTKNKGKDIQTDGQTERWMDGVTLSHL